ncbi:MAG: ABC transporter permease [Bacillota bacterium]|uniref:Oligopeptide ABC transporter, permease protein OppB n=1 Tax=Cytobacillus firmus TaxID=1399 RepID=A0A800MY42_CYTFI|nr:ABC transporter permease [Cytobacillus firmus]KAF0824622.1 Oligopeptide ABC transporter, permease protein OppB [Cytobacillus firmus]MBG9654551.1 peptide ABC transporter permease [Cytobacillus firmus]MED1905625.1 ABC transporter permease [Cytobacillus firmus]NUH83689.1 ABC transporter permease [Cytobacillus firmus]
MKKYLFFRVINILITLYIIATATFFLMKQLPGSPFDEERLSSLSEEQRMEFYAKYGLDKPLHEQYILYLTNLVQGEMGDSFYFKGQDVSGLIASRVGPSALLGFQAVLLGFTVGIVLGIIAAFKHNTMWDFSTMLVAVLGVSVPNFVFAALLQYYVGLKMGLLPVAFWESYSSSIMPTLALSLIVIALIARFTRNEMLEVLQQDYMLTARAKGLSQFKVIYKHAIRNALIPVITILGPIVVSLLTGSLVIENIFGVPGIGSLFVDSIKVNDYTTIMGLTLFYSAFFVLTMLVIDLMYGVIDPRIRISGAKE